MAVTIHPTALVDRAALLDDGVTIGPYAIVEGQVRIGRGTRLAAHVIVHAGVTLGADNVVHPFTVLGGEPQSKKHDAGPSTVCIGDRNVLREHVTVHRGTEGRTTRIGDDNLLMVGTHIAHDAVVGSHCAFANGVQIAGHAVIEDWVTFGGLSGISQFVRVGQSAFVAAGAMCERDVPPFVTVQGDRARVRTLNVVGLRRRGIPENSIARLRGAFRALFKSGRPRAAVLRAIDRDDPWVKALANALEREGSRR